MSKMEVFGEEDEEPSRDGEMSWPISIELSSGSLLLKWAPCREYSPSSTGTSDSYRYDSLDLLCVRRGYR